MSLSASSGLPVVASVGTGSTSGACALAGDVLSSTAPGTCVVSAEQPGSSSYAPGFGTWTITVRAATPAVPPPAVPPPSAAASKARLASSTVTAKAKVLAVRVGCVTGDVCRCEVHLNVARKLKDDSYLQVTVASGTFSVPRGATSTVELVITAKGEPVLARRNRDRAFRLGCVLIQSSTRTRTVQRIVVKR